MGITLQTAGMIADAAKNLKRRNAALMFGYQNLRHSITQVAQAIKKHMPDLDIDHYTKLNSDETETDSKIMFEMMGFDRIVALDIFEYEHADIIADLTTPVEGHDNQYDLIFDGGTMEHTAHPGSVLANAARMLRPGGIVIHQTPMNNYVNHGYFMVSPIFFHDFHALNGFSEMTLFVQSMDNTGSETFTLSPSPLEIPHLSEDMEYSSFFIAKKVSDFGEYIMPVQSLDCVRGDVLQHFKRLICGKKAVVWGTSGAYENSVRPFFEEHSQCSTITGFIDSNKKKQGLLVDGIPVYAPEELDKLNPEVVIIASTYRYEIINMMSKVSKCDFRVL